MGIDASIPLGVKPLVLPNPVDQYGNALKLQGMQQSIATNALAQQAAQRDYDNQNALQQKFQDPNFGSEPFQQQTSDLMAAGGAQAAPVVKNMVEARAANSAYQTSQQALAAKQQMAGVQILESSKDSTDLQSRLNMAVQAGVLDQNHADNLMQHAPTDQTQFSNWASSTAKAILSPKEQLDASTPTVTPVQTQGGTQFANTNANAGPIGPMAGTPTLAPPNSVTSTPSGLMTTNSTSGVATPIAAAPMGTPPPGNGSPIVPSTGFPRLSPSSPPPITGNQAPAVASSASMTIPPAVQAARDQQGAQMTAPPASQRPQLVDQLNTLANALPHASPDAKGMITQQIGVLQRQLEAIDNGTAGTIPANAPSIPNATPGAVQPLSPTSVPPTPPPVPPQAGAPSVVPDLNKNFADYSKDLDTSVGEGRTFMNQIGEFRNAMANYQTGPGADTRLAVAKAAAAMGAPESLVNSINRGSISDAVEIQKLQARTAMQDLNQAVNGGKINKTEYQAFLSTNPGIDTDPNAIEKIYNFAGRQFQQKYAEQQALSEYRKAGQDVTQWPATWSKILTDHNISNPQLSTGQARGTTPPASSAAPSSPMPMVNQQGWNLHVDQTTGVKAYVNPANPSQFQIAGQ